MTNPADTSESSKQRILVIDDNESIHADIRKILSNDDNISAALSSSRAALFGEPPLERNEIGFEIDSAHQGQQGLKMIERALQTGRPYAMAFVDIRMPPGWDGIETLQRIWKVYPELQAVICTAYTDYTLEEMIAQLGHSDRWMVLKKPFDNIEVHQLASALARKWELTNQARIKLDQMERMVQERTAALEHANQNLDHLRATAEAANQAKSEFLANMSHEIRTPMTAILGFSDILSENVTNPISIDAVETIKRNGEHLLAVINDILDLSKIEAGKITVESLRCSLCEILAEVGDLMEDRAREAGLPLKIEFKGPIPESIETDPTRLRQILINLLSNAIKFTEQGEVKMVASLVDADNTNPQLKFDVTDTGIGINEQRIESLFNPFTQADSSTTRQFGGTGLGLAISRRLARLLGGDITVRSEPGQGSTFSATILTGSLNGVNCLENGCDTSQYSAQQSKTHRQIDQLDCRILLAEDGIDTQRLLTLLLEKVGANITIVNNGQKAVDAALAAQTAGQPFDVILMDMQMPVLDGYDATRTLRRAGYSRPIIALTAHAMIGDREKCLAAGCDDYLSKPIDREQLIETISFRWQTAKQTGSTAE